MNYWFTTKWPPRENDRQSLPPPVRIPDGKSHIAADMAPGDLIFIYQTKNGPTRILEGDNGTKRVLRCQAGRQGVIALCEISGELQSDCAQPEQYEDGTERWWRYCAPIRTVNSTGFLCRERAATLLGYSKRCNFRGFGTEHSGIKQIDKNIFDAICREFDAQS